MTFITGRATAADQIEFCNRVFQQNQEDWEFVRRVGCAQAQGYFIARPMAAADLAGWCADWSARRRSLCAR